MTLRDENNRFIKKETSIVQEEEVKPIADTRKVTRQSRKPFGSTDQKLAFPARPGFHQHWFNDEPGRVVQAKEAGYEHVNDQRGVPVSRVVGVTSGGGPLIAYLMEIPQEWWEEDMARQQKLVDEKMADIRRGHVDKRNPLDLNAFYAGSDRGNISIQEGTSANPRGKSY